MLLILILILLLIWAAVVWSIYSNFLVFYSNFSESENYHKAYYASISALERWELVTKQRYPWYVWSGWFILWVPQGGDPNNNDWWSDKSLTWFSYFGDNEWESTVFRSVNSRTTRIPTISGWDVEWMLSAEDSPNYNMMDYENAQVFLLYTDNSAGNPYNSWSISKSTPTQIRWIIRLPALMTWKFWILNTNEPLGGAWWYLKPKNDAIVDRQIRWLFNGKSFTIYSTDSSEEDQVKEEYDSVFREADINTPLEFLFRDRWDPIKKPNNRSNSAKLTVISQEEGINSLGDFKNVFSNNKTSSNQLRFSLLNLLKWKSHTGAIYPFLEYYVDFWTDVSDKYYKIEAEWNYKDYKVNTTIYKPTVKETVLWNFTTIF